MKQNTIDNEAQISGTGIHTGKKSTVRFLPAEADAGIYFVRTDLKKAPQVSASWENVCDTQRSTTIGSGGVKIRTVEHLMSAVFGAGVHNLRIEIDGEELPVLDGSGKVYYELVTSCGKSEQSETANEYTLQQEFSFTNIKNNSFIKITPSDDLKITFHLNYSGKIKQDLTYLFSTDSYDAEIAPARTFSMLSELESMIDLELLGGLGDAAGFAVIDDISKLRDLEKKLSMSLEAFVHAAGDQKIVSKEKLRFDDEMVRHKILDIIGDFALCGSYIRGHIEACGTGHYENSQLIKKIFRQIIKPS